MSNETDRIERDISDKRHRLNDTIEALGNKLSPGQLVDEAMGLLHGQAGQMGANLGRQVRDNPLPAVLIAAGIALYVINRDKERPKDASAEAGEGVESSDWDHDRQFRSVEQARWSTTRQASETEDAFHDRLHQAHATALDLRQNAGEAMDAFKQRVADTVRGLEQRATSARDRLGRAISTTTEGMRAGARQFGAKATGAKHAAQDLYADNPLAGGAIAMAIGALLGSSTPLTDMERDNLSGMARKTADAGNALLEKGASALERTPPVH